jgi:hypothetical protein
VELAHLRTALDAEYAVVISGRTAVERRSGALRLFEICCAYEQVCSDLYFDLATDVRHRFHASARTFAASASRIAHQVLFADDGADGLRDTAQRAKNAVTNLDPWLATTPDDLPERYTNLPECFMRDLVDLEAYGRFALRQVIRLAPPAAIVIGIRTTGSYLAPIWDAALRSIGTHTIAVTARPRRSPRIDASGHFADPSPTDRWVPPDDDRILLDRTLARHDPQLMTAIVIDDLAFTGSSFVRIDNYLTDIGIPASGIVFVQDTPLVMNSLTPEAKARMTTRRVLAAPRVDDGPTSLGEAAHHFFGDLLSNMDCGGPDVRVTSVELAPATFAQRHLAARTTVPVEQFVHFNPRGRDRHYRLEATVDGQPTRLFAKVFGVGFFAEKEVERIRRFRELAYRVLTHAGGFLFYEWIDGDPLGSDDAHLLGDVDIERISEYAAALRTLNPAGHVTAHGYAMDVVDRLRRAVDMTDPGQDLLGSAVTDFLRRAPGWIPLVNAPRNQGHWHHVRSRNRGLLRVHLDLGEWSWKMDAAEELASAVIELGLSSAQERRLVSDFAARTGEDTVADRMRLATISYVTRMLDSYRYWDGQIEQIPTRYRRDADHPLLVREQHRRSRMLRSLYQALGSRDEEMAGRG